MIQIFIYFFLKLIKFRDLIINIPYHFLIFDSLIVIIFIIMENTGKIKNMKKSTSLIILMMVLVVIQSLAQEKQEGPVQTIKGTIVNFKNRMPIAGVTVQLMDTKFGAYSKKDGSFRIENVPPGRYTMKCSAVGYETKYREIVLTSGKQQQLEIEMTESVVEMKGIEVTGEQNIFDPINESAMISSTKFSKDDVERFAGSRLDPARMAQNYAGVLGANDQRNDIIIRGGSPVELLWRLDGLDIPNPNHFATQGATGGPISAINSNLLADSDFLTGAFPAEYGDRLSGVFDLKTRRGNEDRYEFIGQFGFNGFEMGAEGPIPTQDASFIANYRYSFLDFLDMIGFDFGFAGIPRYQDGTLKLDYEPAEGHRISVTGLFGISDIDIKESKEDDVYTGDSDIRNGTDFWSLGVNWQHIFSEKLYGKLLLGSTFGKYRTDIDSITTTQAHRVTSIDPWLAMDSYEGCHTAKYSIHYSPDKHHFITAGTELRYNYYNFYEERFTAGWNTSTKYLLDKSGNATQSLNYVNWNWRINEDITANLGLHSQYLAINDKASVEPRLGFSWRLHKRHEMNLGFGIHRQSLPLLIYFTEEGNEDLDFMQSIHYIAGYNFILSENAIIKIEGYYKDISKAPVEADEESSWSLLNSGTNFGIIGSGIAANSTGTGRTYGAEFSLIKHFADHYYLTAAASYVRQQYTGSDGIRRWGAFDNQYIFNILSGYELIISPSFTLEFSIKWTLAGGGPYTPIDMEKSRERGQTMYLDEEAFTLRKPDYSRFDLRIDLRHNMEGVSVISFFSLENVFNKENVLMYQYNARNDIVETIPQLGIFPVGGVRVEF